MAGWPNVEPTSPNVPKRRMAKRRGWTETHEIERLTQLRADVESALGRLMTECELHSVGVAKEVESELNRQWELLDAICKQQLENIDRWITECCSR